MPPALSVSDFLSASIIRKVRKLPSFDWLEFIGYVETNLTRIRDVCRTIPDVVGPQLIPRNCQHWAQDALAALTEAGVFRDLRWVFFV